jgi:protein-S-isoprenylcysteine O-methyltransferase Ste14
MTSSARPFTVERTVPPRAQVHGAALALVALLALWLGAHRTLDRPWQDSLPEPGDRKHAVAQRL